MKIKSLNKRIFFILLFCVFTDFSNVFAQDPKPDKSTTDPLSEILNGPKSDGIYKYTDREILQKNIQSSFLNWSQKGEFEKQADYEVRIQKQSQSKFTEICIEEIKKKINSFSSSDLNINLLTYDAENEVFPTISKFKDKEWKNKVKISIDKAKNFKENEWRFLRWQKEESSWCFIYNDMFPSKIYLKSNSFDITFTLPLPNQEEITVAFNDLRVENPYLKDFIFNNSTAMENEKENNIYSSDGIPSARIDYGNNQSAGDKGSTDRDPNASAYYGNGKGLDGDGNYKLGGRRALNKEKFVQDCNEAGIVVVEIKVNQSGQVISAMPGVKGTTNNAACLKDPAKRAALATTFNSDPNSPSKQVGFIIYNFKLSE